MLFLVTLPLNLLVGGDNLFFKGKGGLVPGGLCSNRSGANSAQLFIYCSVGPKTQANYSVKGPFLGLRNCKNVFLSFFQNNKLFKYDADISTRFSLKLKCRPLIWF